jgi:hypothetical protein
MQRLYIVLLLLFSCNFLVAQFIPTNGPLKYDFCHAVYADDDVVLVAGGLYLYRSTDQGQTFQPVQLGNSGIDVRCLTRVNNTLILGGIHQDKIYRSTDLGLTWQASYTGMPMLSGVPVPVPRVALTVGNRVFMGGTNFFRYSDDEGLTWQSTIFDGIISGLSYTGGEVWVHSSSGGSRYSTDNGNTWLTPATNPFSSAFATNGYARTSQALVAVSDASAGFGAVRSLDNGQTWSSVGSLSIVRSLVQVGDTLFSTSFGGLRRSVDHGVSWQPVGTFSYDVVSGFNGKMYVHGNYLWVGTTAGPVKVNMTDDSYQLFQTPGAIIKHMVAAGGILFGASDNALYKWISSTSSWDDISQNLPLSQYTIEQLSSHDDTLYIMLKSNNVLTLYKSSDGGNTFVVVTVDPAGGTLTSFFTYNPMFIGIVTSFKPGIRKSTDGGATWTNSTITDLNNQPTNNNGVINRFVRAGGYLFVWVNYGFMFSTDDGETWRWDSRNGPGSAAGWPGRMISLSGETWFNNWQIRESTDGGNTWNVLETGLPVPAGNNSVLNNKLHIVGDLLYVQIVEPGGEHLRFYYLEAGSSTWIADPSLNGLPGLALSLSLSGQKVFASLETGGVYVAGGQIDVSRIPVVKHHLEIWPNPASEAVNVKVPEELVHPGLTTISVFDLQGRQVAKQLVPCEVSVLQLGYLPAGVYLIQISAPNGTASSRLMVR